MANSNAVGPPAPGTRPSRTHARTPGGQGSTSMGVATWWRTPPDPEPAPDAERGQRHGGGASSANGPRCQGRAPLKPRLPASITMGTGYRPLWTGNCRGGLLEPGRPPARHVRAGSPLVLRRLPAQTFPGSVDSNSVAALHSHTRSHGSSPHLDKPRFHPTGKLASARATTDTVRGRR
jgi:hypothetical protein